MSLTIKSRWRGALGESRTPENRKKTVMNIKYDKGNLTLIHLGFLHEKVMNVNFNKKSLKRKDALNVKHLKVRQRGRREAYVNRPLRSFISDQDRNIQGVTVFGGNMEKVKGTINQSHYALLRMWWDPYGFHQTPNMEDTQWTRGVDALKKVTEFREEPSLHLCILSKIEALGVFPGIGKDGQTENQPNMEHRWRSQDHQDSSGAAFGLNRLQISASGPDTGPLRIQWSPAEGQ